MELTADEARKIKVPRRWKEVYDLLEKQRDDIVTPVDTMGCEENGLEERRADRGRLRACLLYTSPSPRDVEESRMPSSA